MICLFFLNSDKKIPTSGFINFQDRIVELVTCFIMSYGKNESSMCFEIKKPIELMHSLFVSHKCSYCIYIWLSSFALSSTMYCRIC